MSGVYHLEITESETELKTLLGTQKTAFDKERIQLLYLLKSEQAQTIQQATALLGRHRVTVQKWAKRSREGGLNQLLSHKPRSGRKSTLPQWVETALGDRLAQPEGFESYTAIQQWLTTSKSNRPLTFSKVLALPVASTHLPLQKRSPLTPTSKRALRDIKGGACSLARIAFHPR